MNHLAKQLINEDEEPIEREDQVWHVVTRITGGELGLLCTGEYIEHGCGSGTYEEKMTKRGGITCKECLEKIKEIKAIKL